MEVLLREAKFKRFFLLLGVPFVFLGTFGFIFMGVALGFDFPPPYMCLIFTIVGFVMIMFDVKSWMRYFNGKKIVREGADGTATFVSFFKSTYYIKSSYNMPYMRRLNYYGIEFSFVDGYGNTVKQKTPFFLRPNETEALRQLGEFEIKHINGTAVITHDLKRAIAELKLEDITALD